MTRTRIDSFIIGFLYPAVLGVFLFSFLNGVNALERHWSYGVLPLIYLCTQFVETDTSKNRNIEGGLSKKVAFFGLELVEMTMFYQILVSLGLANPVFSKPTSLDLYFYALAIMLLTPVIQRCIRGFKTARRRFQKTILSVTASIFALIAGGTQNEAAELLAISVFALALVWYICIIYSYNYSRSL